MRFMVIVKGDSRTEAGVMPTDQELTNMARYNEELVKAGVMLDGTGLHPTSKGAKVQFKGGRPVVIDGPFTEAKEIIAGYWIIQVKNKAEAIEWAKRIPFGEIPGSDRVPAVEIRQLFELEDGLRHRFEVPHRNARRLCHAPRAGASVLIERIDRLMR
jgi:hypothetical protein